MKHKNIQQELRAYSGLAAAFMLTATTDVAAQCGSTTPGTPLDIDIDGDGITDVSLVQNSNFHYFHRDYYDVYNLQIFSVNFANGVLSFTTIKNNSTVSMDSVNGINTNSFATSSATNTFVNLTFPPTPNVIPAGSVFYPVGCPSGAVATASFAYGYGYNDCYFRRVSYTFTSSRRSTSAYAQPALGNSIIGLASSANVCNAALTPDNIDLGSNGTYRAFGFSKFRTLDRRIYGSSFTVSNLGVTCAGAVVELGDILLPFTSTRIIDTTVSTTFINTTTTFQNTNPTEYLAVQFQADPDGNGINETYNGWVALTIDTVTSQITCTNTGYQQCSVEDAIATGDTSLACITTGEATNSNAACVPVCTITAQVVEQMCDDNATPELGADDIITFTVILNGTNGTTWSDNQGNTGQIYGTAVTYSLLAGSTLNLTFSDDDAANVACTSALILTATDCMTVENIPTTSEWGLSILGLLMSITAVVGIRQSRQIQGDLS